MKSILKVTIILISLFNQAMASQAIYDAGYKLKNQIISEEEFLKVVDSQGSLRDPQAIDFIKTLGVEPKKEFMEETPFAPSNEDQFLKDLEKAKEPMGVGSFEQSSQNWILGASLLLLVGYGLRDKQVSVRLFKF